MAAVQIVPVARRAGIAAGTVYRYFPAKTDLVAAVVTVVREREIAALRTAADAAPGPLSALAAALATFAARALANRRLTWAVLAEPVEPEIDGPRATYRTALLAEIEGRLKRAIDAGNVSALDVGVVAPALIGALLEGLIGPLSGADADDPARSLDAVRTLTLLALRGVGVSDGHARGLVMQATVPKGKGK